MKVLVIGSGACLWNDLRALGPWDGIVIGVNDAGAIYPYRIDAFATLHPEKLPGWKAERVRRGGNTDFTTWGAAGAVGTDRTVGGWSLGSSGMLAVGVALEMGAECVVLAGVPMDTGTHFYGGAGWTAARIHQEAWRDKLDAMQGRVFSMSGWTRELLGSPPFLSASEAA